MASKNPLDHGWHPERCRHCGQQTPRRDRKWRWIDIYLMVVAIGLIGVVVALLVKGII